MKMLKLKAKMYQYTGLYLAQNEERKFLKSKSFWKKFKSTNSDGGMTSRDVQKYILLEWHKENGFRRPASKHLLYDAPVHIHVVSWFERFCLQLKFDLKLLTKKLSL